MKNARLALFVLVSCVLGLLAAAGFYLAFVPDEETQDAPLSQAEMHGPLMRLGQPPRPVPTPVPTPTPAPTPAPVPPSEREALAILVHQTFPDDLYMGGYVVWAETLSRDDWRDYVYDGKMSVTNDCGLMQTNWYWHSEKYAAHGWTLADCFVPEKNLVVAREIYNDAGCGAWSTC